MNRWRILLVLLCVACVPAVSHLAVAQIPNAGFQDWTAGNPNDWFTTNDPGNIVNVTQTTDAHSGGSAVLGEVVNFFSFPYPPTISAGSDGQGFPESTREPAVHGWYKFDPMATDQFLVIVGMSIGDSAIGAGGFLATGAQSVYREFVANIAYGGSANPDTCIIAMFIGNTGGFSNIGSKFWADDLAFGPVSSVDEHGNLLPDEYALLQNYPNPFNPSTLIQYAIPRSGRVDLRVYDILGREIATLLNNEAREEGLHELQFDASSLSSGVYFYQLDVHSEEGNFSATKKLLLMK